MEAEALVALGLSTSNHDKLPDIVPYDSKGAELFLIEAVRSHGPVFVSAFFDMADFRKHMKEIGWETEVWIAETPDHMIHFNGDRFLGPRK